MIYTLRLTADSTNLVASRASFAAIYPPSLKSGHVFRPVVLTEFFVKREATAYLNSHTRIGVSAFLFFRNACMPDFQVIAQLSNTPTTLQCRIHVC